MTYTATGTPADGAGLQSAEMRAEFLLIQAETDKLPTVTGNGGKIIAVNAGGTAEEAITTTGTGNGVRATSPTLVTPTLGVATATSINKVTITQPATASTLTVADGKTLTASNTLTLTATDGSTLAIGTGGTLGTAAYIAASSKQDVDATLTSLSALGTAADKLAYTTGVDTWAETPLTAFARSILDDANEATFKATVNLEIGTDVQAYDAQLADIAGLTPTDNGVVIGNGTNFVVESGATLKASLGLTIGTDIQAYDADLTTWAGVTPGAGVTTALAVAVGSAGALVANGGALGTPSSGVTDNLTTTTSAAAITDTDFVDTNLAAGGKRKILWTAVKTYLGTTFAALAGSASQAFSMTTAAANTNSTQGATTAYADRLTAGTLPGAFTALSATGTVTHISSTTGNNTCFNSTTSGIYANYSIWQSTGGVLQFGLDDSAGSVFGTAAYGCVLNAPASTFIQVNGVNKAVVSSTGLAVTGAFSATTTIKTGGYTVATLPAGIIGDRAYVTDATAPTYLGALTGGGAIVCPVFKNASAWVSA